MAQWQQMQAQAAQYYGYDSNGGWNRGQGGRDQNNYGASGGGGGYGGDAGRRERSQPSSTLWVGNLTPAIREDDIRRAFEQYGPIESVRMLDSKNCAFVTFANLESSKNAHASTYGLKINGAEVKINWGRPNNPNPREGGGGGYGGNNNYAGGQQGGYGGNQGGGGGYQQGGYGQQQGGYQNRGPREENQPSPNIWVGNVDPNVTEHELRTCFDRFGAIERVKLFPQKNCAFINFVELNSALAAKAEMNGFALFGQMLRVNFGKPRAPGGDREERGPRYGGDRDGGRDFRDEGRGPRYDSHHGGQQQHHQQVSAAPSIPVSEPHDIPQESKDFIDKLVGGFESNPELEAMTKQNQAENPKFAFLFPGREGHNYYLWKRYGSKLASAATNASDIGAGKFDATLPANAEPLNANESEDLEGILRTLDGNKDPIMAGADFATKNAKKAPAVATAILDYALNRLSPSQNVLHFVYLVNELFNVVLRSRANPGPDTAELQQLAVAFLPGLPRLLQSANSGENSQITSNILNRWKGEKVFSNDEFATLESSFLAGEPNKKRKRDTDEAEDSLEAKRPAPASE